MKPTLGDQVHYVGQDRYGQYQPCRLAVITEVPPILQAEPFDGCPNGSQGLWLASLIIFGRTGFAFEEDVDYLHPNGSDQLRDDDITTTWHTATDCGEAP
jgi:hypothetical protein